MPRKGVQTTPSGIIKASPVPAATPQIATQNQKPMRYTPLGIPMFGEVQTAGREVNVDPVAWTEYKRMVDNPFLGDPRMENLADLQSGWEQTVNALGGALYGVGAGIAEGVGSWDISDTIGMAAGINKEYGNAFHQRAMELNKEGAERFPIYEQDPGSFSPGDPGWWAKQVQSMGFTGGFFVEGAAEQLLFSAFTGGLGNEASLASKMRALTNLTRAGAKAAGKEAFWGAFKGMQEATSNNFQTYDETYDKFIKLNYKPEDAQRLAAVAASSGFRTEAIPTMLLNAIQYSTLAHNPVTGKTYSPFLEGIENKYIKGLTKGAVEAGGETFEETYQTIASMEGKYRADVMAGLTQEKDFNQRLQEYMGTSELWNSAAGGFLGGLMFMGVGGARNGIYNAMGGNRQEKAWEQYKQGMDGLSLKYLEEIRAAEKAGKPMTAAALKREMSMLTAVNSYHIDHLKNDLQRGTYQAHEASLQGILDAAKAGDTETLKAFKVGPDDIQYVLDEFPGMIADSKEATRIYDSLKNENDASVLVPLTYRMQSINKMTTAQAGYQADIDSAVANLDGAEDLSAKGREIVQNSYYRNALRAEEQAIRQRMADPKVEGAESEMASYQSRLAEIMELQTEAGAEYTRLVKELDQEDTRTTDKKIMASLPEQRALKNLFWRSISTESTLGYYRDDMMKLSDKEYQAKLANDRINRKITNAKSKQEVDEALTAEAQSTEDGKNKEKTKRKARKRKEDIEAREAGNEAEEERRAAEAARKAAEAAANPAPGAASGVPGTNGAAGTSQSPSSPTPPDFGDPDAAGFSSTGAGGTSATNTAGAPTASTAGTSTAAPPPVTPRKRGPKASVSPGYTKKESEQAGADFANMEAAASQQAAASGHANDLDAIFGPRGQAGYNPDSHIENPGGGAAKSFSPQVITDDMIDSLTDNGYSEEEIHKMTAAQAYNILRDIDTQGNKYADADDFKALPAEEVLDLPRSEERARLASELTTSNTEDGPKGFRNAPDNTVVDSSNHFSPEYDREDARSYAEWEAEVTRKMKNYVEHMANELNKEPGEITFRSFLKDLVSYIGKEEAAENFETYKLGWRKNGFKQTDFEADYKAMFGNRADMAMELVALGYRVEGASEAEVRENNAELEEQTGISDDPTMFVPLPNGAHATVKTGYKTVEPTLKWHFLNVGYTEVERVDPQTGQTIKVKINDEVVYTGPDIDSRYTMDPNRYGEGTIVETGLPKNPESVYVTQWNEDYTAKTSVRFGEWAFNNGIEPGSRAWNAKIPILIYDADGTPVAMIPDTEWYNPANVGFESDPEKQAELIREARTNLMALRNKILSDPKGAMKLEVSFRGNGSKVKTEPGTRIKVSEADPTAPMGFGNSSGQIQTDHGLIDSNQLVNYKTGEPQEIVSGRIYDLRQCNTRYDSRTGTVMPVYMAMETKQTSLSPEAINSIKWALKIYLSQSDSEGRVMSVRDRVDMKEQIKAITGFDIYTNQGLRGYLNQFVQTIEGKSISDYSSGKKKLDVAGTIRYIHNKVENNSNYSNGTLYLSIQDGFVVVGVKGEVLTNAESSNVIYIHHNQVSPKSRDVPYDRGVAGVNRVISELESLGSDPARPRRNLTQLKQNMGDMITRKGGEKKNIAIIGEDGTVENYGTYADFLRDNYETDVKGFNIGTEDEPSFATFIHPTINFKYEGEEAALEQEKSTQAKQRAAAAQRMQRQEGVGKKGSEAGAETETETTVTPEEDADTAEADEMAEKYGLDDDDLFSPAYEEVTPELVANVKRSITEIKDMELSEIADVTNNLARRIEGLIDSRYNSSMSRESVKASARDIYNNEIKGESEKLKRASETFQKKGDSRKALALERLAEHHRKIEQNWDALVDDAILEVLASTGIRETSKTIQDFSRELLRAVKDLDLEMQQEQRDILGKAARGERKFYAQAGIIYNEWYERSKEALESEDPSTDALADLELEDLEITTEELNTEEGGERARDYSKTSLQEDQKSSVSYKFRRMLSQIPEYEYSSGKVARGYGGLTKYPGYGYYYDRMQMILTDPTDCLPDYDDMMTRLREQADNLPWVGEFIKKMEAGDQQDKNSFVYGMNLHAANFKFLMLSKYKDTFSAKVYDTNSSQIGRVLTDQWYENFKDSPLMADSGDHLNISEVKKAIKEYENFKNFEGGVPTPQAVQAWLKKFGIEMSDSAMVEMSRAGYRVATGAGSRVKTWKTMFGKPSKSGDSIFAILQDFLISVRDATEGVKDTAAVTHIENADSPMIPLNSVTKLMKSLTAIERKYTAKTSTISTRDGTKTIYGLTNHSHSDVNTLMLKSNAEHRKNLGEVTFNSGSFVLDLLNRDFDFQEKFNVEEIGNNAIKQKGKKTTRDTEITKISDADQETLRVGFLQDKQQGKVERQEVSVFGRTYNLTLRLGRMMFPTMSDKAHMKNSVTAVIDMKAGEDITKGADGNMKLSNNMLSFAFSQLIEPELRRIAEHHAKAYAKNPKDKMSSNKLVNTENYNYAAQLFLGMPMANRLKYKGVTLIKYLGENRDRLSKEHVEEIIDEVRQEAYNMLQDYFARKVAVKIGTREKQGGTWKHFMQKGKKGELAAIRYMDSKYLDELGWGQKTPGQRWDTLTHAALEYVYNTHIHNANNMMLHGMDPAYFSKDKAFTKNKGTEKGFDTQHGEVVPYSYASEAVLFNAIRGPVDTNLGKRLAMLMTPGKMLAGAMKDKYIQLCLKDRVSASENIEYLIDLMYGTGVGKGDQLTPEVQALLKELSNPDDNIADVARGKLQDKFPEIQDYFEIESTDAQEYVTVQEAIDTLYRQGRMSEQDYKTILSKSRKGERLTTQEVDKVRQIVLNPSKPVYTGITMDKSSGVALAKPTYIKCSAIPLIPGAYRNMELDKLRRAMEQIQARTGKNVRASYATANKVGNVLSENRMKIWDNDGNYIPDSIDVDHIVAQHDGTKPITNFMMLERKNFKIQQDVPYKSDKKKEDTVSIVTQAMRTLFGDGILEISDEIFELDGVPKTPMQLYKHYVDNFGDMVRNEKSILYNEIGMDEATGRPKANKKTGKPDVQRVAENIERILRAEGIARGYPKQALQGLEIQKGDGAFVVPVWTSPDHYKYENLLNAIVTSRLVKYRFPGCQLVAASEEGFKFDTTAAVGATTEELLEKYPGIVFTDKWTGKLQAAKYDSEGNFQTAQALMPSKFRGKNDKLIDLVRDGYVIKRDGRFYLDPEKIDPELLSVSSFRSPLSGHVSMSQLEIVGFLPPEQGDVIVLPKNMTKQKGLDFDVDKENLYQLWQTIDAEGKLVVSTRDNMKAGARTETKLAQNEIVKVFHAFLKSKSPEVQGRVNKVLGLKFERDQRDLFRDYTQAVDPAFSIYDDEHQKAKMALGAAGQSGISVYANMMTMHNMIQQAMTRDGERIPMFLMTENEEGDPIQFEFSLGGFTTSGQLGVTKTLDEKRKTSDVVAGRLSIATDNENEQIMGVVGVNSGTIGVDAILTSMGFDQGTITLPGNKRTQASVSFLLLSQPIIKQYVSMMKEYRGVTSDYKANVKADIVKTLTQMYSVHKDSQEEPLGHIETQEGILTTYADALTMQNMFENLNGLSNSVVQQAALHLFLRLEEYAREMVTIQSRVSIQSSGLGKSIPEMLNKYDSIASMSRNKMISGISGLVGEFRRIPEDTESYEKLIAEGAIPITAPGGGTFLVIPNTTTGHMVINALKAGKELWKDYFHYQHKPVKDVVKRLMDKITFSGDSEQSKMQKYYDIMEGMKKYLYSTPYTGMFYGDPAQERYRLFIDNTSKKHPNTSLATYLSRLTNMKSSPTINRIKTNPLISQFTYQLSHQNSERTDWMHGATEEFEYAPSLDKKMEPSYFEYNNAKGADIGDQYKYASLVELLEKNEVIADAEGKPVQFNGIDYTTRMLVTDIISATYLKGGIQKATEIVKYIPVSYLKEIGFASLTRNWQAAAVVGYKGGMQRGPKGPNGQRAELWSHMLGEPVGLEDPLDDEMEDAEHSVWRFERQFLQHNPHLLKTQVPKSITKPEFLDHFEYPVTEEGEIPPKFLYSKVSNDTYVLFEREKGSNTYRRIPVLGTGNTGLSSEYNMHQDYVTSVVNVNPVRFTYAPYATPAAPISSEADTTREGTFGLNEGNLQEILQNIVKDASEEYAVLAEQLLPFIHSDIKIMVADIGGHEGSYNSDTNVIKIGRKFLAKVDTTQDGIAKTILHEYIHALTVREIDKYFEKDGSFKPGYSAGNLPAHITKLHRAFTKVAEAFEPGELDAFAARFAIEKKLVGTADKMRYGGYDMREMLTMLTDPEFRGKLASIKDDQGVSLLQRLAEAFQKILEVLGVPQGTLAASTFEALLDISEAQKQRLAAEAAVKRKTSRSARQIELDRLRRESEARGDFDFDAQGPPDFDFDLFGGGANFDFDAAGKGASVGEEGYDLSEDLNRTQASNDAATQSANMNGDFDFETGGLGGAANSFMPQIESELEYALEQLEVC